MADLKGFLGTQPDAIWYSFKAVPNIDAHATTFAISRSLHYGLFQVFEGIRFYCTRGEEGLDCVFSIFI